MLQIVVITVIVVIVTTTTTTTTTTTCEKTHYLGTDSVHVTSVGHNLDDSHRHHVCKLLRKTCHSLPHYYTASQSRRPRLGSLSPWNLQISQYFV